MIELTKEEAIDIIKAISRIEGFLFSVDDSCDIMVNADYAVNLLAKKLTACEGVKNDH